MMIMPPHLHLVQRGIFSSPSWKGVLVVILRCFRIHILCFYDFFFLKAGDNVKLYCRACLMGIVQSI
jgi:hypothetical protein